MMTLRMMTLNSSRNLTQPARYSSTPHTGSIPCGKHVVRCVTCRLQHIIRRLLPFVDAP